MKLVIVLALMGLAVAAPPQFYPQQGREVQLIKFDNENIGLGNYRYAYELSDGSKHEEQGQLKNQGAENEALSVKGQYSWVGPDGVQYTVIYLADENGYQPEIQQGPGGGVPPAVVASLVG